MNYQHTQTPPSFAHSPSNEKIIRESHELRDHDTSCPCTTYLSPCHTAMVFSFVVSNPAVGLVTAKQAFSSTAIRGPSIHARCLSVPNFTTGLSPTMLMWIAEAPLAPAADLAIA